MRLTTAFLQPEIKKENADPKRRERAYRQERSPSALAARPAWSKHKLLFYFIFFFLFPSLLSAFIYLFALRFRQHFAPFSSSSAVLCPAVAKV